MSNTSLVRLCEDFFIALLRAQPELRGKVVVHHEEDRKAQTNLIVVKADVGEKRLDGPGGYDVTITFTYMAGAKSTAPQNDLTATAIAKGAVNEGRDPLDTATIRQLQRDANLAFVVSLEQSGARQDQTHSLRERIVTLPVIADSL